MKPVVVLASPVPEEVLHHLEEQCELRRFDAPRAKADLAAFHGALVDAQGLIGAGMKIDAQFLTHAPQLRVVSTISAGYDTIKVDDLTARNVALFNTSGALAGTTADTALALMLAVARRVVELDGWVRAGQWQKGLGPEHFGVDVQGKTLGIIGMGSIGAEVARRGALGFGMRVLYTKRTPNRQAEQAYGARQCDLHALLTESDFVCVTVPLTPQTRNLIGAEQIASMKPNAVLVNIARGGIVDETALAAALKAGHLAGAGLDVFETEPTPADNPLLKLPNVVALPHIGSATVETRHAMAVSAAQNLLRALAGNPDLKNAVNPVVLERSRAG
ncbi:2-hydroxyacid dehydrogenase [Silvimonas amylolytica]|uniref:Glyoxylate/hydroxypyruvate reductase B n=1 Tax=Silvimonas amylolytica TaxID=449663 RepID=A0ABQ2PHM0_9NEIS|nr:D-glycerate dehydrogenase [Silvimonas amylolytica]GGP24741.1 glyoxylate/hydroxypyruvate reductase B [Silvimonas amylolytica]